MRKCQSFCEIFIAATPSLLPRLCRALGLTRVENGLDLTADTLFLCDGPEDVGLPPVDAGSYILRTGKRIGIDYAEEAVDFPWRFWLERTNLC